MIISASRRTDIAAFYSDWFMNRIRAGFCTVPNPMNRKQVSQISLDPADVDVLAFWTRDSRPLLPHLSELDQRGYRYYFQFSLLGYPGAIDPKSPRTSIAVPAFRRLADRIGPQRVIWRYDPIVFTKQTSVEYHESQFAFLAEQLRGSTRRCVISAVDIYRKIGGRVQELAGTPAEFVEVPTAESHRLIERLSAIARANDMEITSCAEPEDWSAWGVRPGKCIDPAWANRLFGIALDGKKDPHQREACGCAVSRDIGMYDTCLFGCAYCYATTSFARARERFASHDALATSLV